MGIASRPRPDGMATTLRSTVQSTPYDEEIIRLFVIATTFWGVVGFTMGVFIAFQLAYPALNFDLPVELRSLEAGAYFGRHFRLRRQRPDRHLALRRAADLPRVAVRRAPSRPLPVLGLPGLHRARRFGVRPGRDAEPRVRRAGMVCRSLARRGLGHSISSSSWAPSSSGRSRTSTSPTGITSRSS